MVQLTAFAKDFELVRKIIIQTALGKKFHCFYFFFCDIAIVCNNFSHVMRPVETHFQIETP